MTNSLLTQLINGGLDNPLFPILSGALPKQQDKLRLMCLLEPTFSPERFMKTLSITYDGQILWTHEYVLYAQSGGDIPLVAAGGGLSAELSQIRQVYHIKDDTARWSREECESRLRNNPISFPPCDDRSLVAMVEAGEVKYKEFFSRMIRRIESDSRFCEIIFVRGRSTTRAPEPAVAVPLHQVEDVETSEDDAEESFDQDPLSQREQVLLDSVRAMTERNHALSQQYAEYADVGLLFFDTLAAYGSRIPHPSVRIPSSLYLAGRGLHKITSRMPPKLFSKAQGSGGAGTGKTRIQNPHKSQSPIWKGLQRYKKNIKTNGETGSKERYYQWDHTHNDIEVFGPGGREHLGSMHPQTGKIYKDPKPNYRLDLLER